MRINIKLFLTIFVCFILVSCECAHVWNGATCMTAKTCALCGETEGDPIENGGHVWKNATCTAPKTCEICGEVSGYKLGHIWIEASCSAAKTCGRCSRTEGLPTDHMWINATCNEPMTCDFCGTTKGSKLGHEWNAATCTTPMTCERCGNSTGEELGHIWADATCSSPLICTRCEEKTGKALGHSYYAGKCKRCEKKDENFFLVYNSQCSFIGLLGVITDTLKFSKYSYEIKNGDDLYIYLEGEKIYDWRGNKNSDIVTFQWKLYDNSKKVIASRVEETPSIKVSDKFSKTIIVKDIDLSKKYSFYILDDGYFE